MTLYLVLRKYEEETKDAKLIGGWRSVGETEAASANAAIRSMLTELNSTENGEFVAVPARSWQPVKVSVEQSLKFS